MICNKKRDYTIAHGVIVVKPTLPSLESALSLQEAQEYFNQVENRYPRKEETDIECFESHGHALHVPKG